MKGKQRVKQLKKLWCLGLMALALVGLGSASQQENIWLYGGGSFAPNETINLSYSIPRNKRADLNVYRIMNPAKVLSLGGPRNFSGVNDLDLRLERKEEIFNRRDNYGDIRLEPLPLGLYYVQIQLDKDQKTIQDDGAATLILVTDLGLVVKSDDQRLLSYSAHLTSGEPLAAEVYVLNDRGIQEQGQADQEGLKVFDIDTAINSVYVAANYEASWVFSDAFWSSWAQEKAKIYLHTDRPVYRPDHTVFFKGIARLPRGLSPLSDETANVIIRDSEGTEVLNERYQTDTFGSFDGELLLGDEPPLGYYSIETTVAGHTAYSGFQVEAFQKPEFRVSVSSDKAALVQGDKAKVTIKAEYLFGGPVSAGELNYSIVKQAHYPWAYPARFGFYDDSVFYNYGGDIVDQGQARLDEQGEFILELELDPDERDYQLRIQARVSDEARREISSSANIVAYRSNVSLNITSSRYAHKAGEDVEVKIEAKDIEGNPLSVAVELEAERSYWQKGEGEQRERIQTQQGQTDDSGIAFFKLNFEEQGVYTLRAKAKDAAGRTSSSDWSVWISDGSPWYWAYNTLSMTADKEEYQVGDLARFVIRSPLENAFVLISHEGSSLRDYELVQLDGSVLTYELPVTEDMTPNSHLSAVIIGNNEYYQQSLEFSVPPTDKFLHVEITSNSDTYKPQDTGIFALRVSDQEGKGVHAQVAVGLVDEAIYLIQEETSPNIREFFYAHRANVVGTQLARWFYFGQAENEAIAADSITPSAVAAPSLEEANSFGALSGRALDKAAFAPAETREDFQDTILWLPYVETDETGFAEVRVEFPDNLTEWRLSARAITLDDEVGQNTYTVMTTLPVIARLAAPRFFIRGDEASLRVIGQNNLETPQEGQLSLSAEGLDILNPGPQASTFPAKGRTSHDVAISAPLTGTSSLTASALTEEASDALKLEVPVLPHGIREEIAWANSGSSQWAFGLEDTVDLTSTKGKLYLTPSLAAAVSPALSYLAGYPYGCTEQTMSRFLPSVLAAQAGDLAKLPEDIAENLDDMVQKGLKRLYDFQQDDGGWGFWQHDESNLFISSYVVNGLLDAKQAGYAVRNSSVERALSYLETAVQANTLEDNYRVVAEDAKAYAFYALARAGRNAKAISKQDPESLSAYGLALHSLALVELNHKREANRALDILLSTITERDRVAFWETDTPKYYWNDDRVEATAYGLEALVRLRPEEPIIAKVVNWLLLERQGNRWVSTKDTAAVIKAALSLASVKDEASFDYEVSVSMNGEQLENRRIQGQDTESFEIALENFTSGNNVLDVQIAGQGTLYASAGINYVAERDYLEPETEHMDIERRYEVLESVYNEEEGRYMYEAKPLSTETKLGEHLLVTVTIDPKDAYRYVMVNEPLPAGYRVIEDDQAFRVVGLTPRYGYDWYGWNYWYDGRDIRDERVDYYFSHLSDKVSFTYILRAETPGHFTALPTQAWLMYEPEVRGIGPQAVLKVAKD